jgi:hypothetical protein
MKRWMIVLAVVLLGLAWSPQAWAQIVSGVRAFGGGVAPLFNLVGPGNLYLDNQGTQGYMYTPGNNFQSYSYRNPTTGQAWSGAVMTLGPQLSIGLIQGTNQVGSPLVLIPPPPEPGSSLVSPFSLNLVTPPVTPVSNVNLTTAPLVGGGQLVGGTTTGGRVPSLLLAPPLQPPSPLEIESSVLEIP